MGIVDKIKNALFEVEYVEVEEPKKPVKKEKVRRETATNKPIAKKVVLPEKKEKPINIVNELDCMDDKIPYNDTEDLSIDAMSTSVVNKFPIVDEADLKVDDRGYDDVTFMIEALVNAKRIYELDRDVYVYRINIFN